jgi:hypothetical protein
MEHRDVVAPGAELPARWGVVVGVEQVGGEDDERARRRRVSSAIRDSAAGIVAGAAAGEIDWSTAIRS